MFALIQQEYVRHLRGKRLFVWSTGFAAVASIVIGVMWPSFDASTGQIGVASQSMVELLAALLALAAALIVPAYGGAAIALERERETYDQLRLTLIPSAAIIAAKLIGVLAIFSTTLITLLPVLASTYFLLGLDIDAIGKLVAISFAAAFSGASIGLLCSAAFRRMPIAQTVTFILVFAVLGSTGALLTITSLPLSSYFAKSLLYEFAPARALQSLVAGLVDAHELFTFAAIHAVIGVLALIGAMQFLAYDARQDRLTEPQVPIPRRGMSRRQHKPRGAIGNWSNPVAARETRWGELVTWRWQVRLFVVSCAIQTMGLVGMIAALSPGIPPRAEMWVALQMGLALFLIPGMTASTIVQERARHSFDFLLMSGMRPSSIFFGKVLGVLASMGGVLLPCLLSMALAPWVYPTMTHRDLAIFATGLVSLLVWMFVCACASTYACAAMERPTAAFAGSYILCTLVFAGFGSGLFALKFYGAGSAFLSPVLGFLEKSADAGNDPIDQFSGPWMWHVFTHLLLGLLFIFLALREVDPFAQRKKQRWR